MPQGIKHKDVEHLHVLQINRNKDLERTLTRAEEKKKQANKQTTKKKTKQNKRQQSCRNIQRYMYY